MKLTWQAMLQPYLQLLSKHMNSAKNVSKCRIRYFDEQHTTPKLTPWSEL